MRRVCGTALALAICTAAAAQAGDRFPELKLDQMSAEQRNVAEAIVAGPRRGMAGPFNAWLRSPELADRLQKVGEYVRFKTSLPPRLNELAILITAREWTSQYEWYAHHPLALNAGLDPKIAAAVAAGERPAGMAEDESVVYDFCIELHRNKHVDDATYKAAVAKLSEQGVIDLIGVSGYYTAVSMTLNVAEVPLPEGEKPPLAPLDR